MDFEDGERSLFSIVQVFNKYHSPPSTMVGMDLIITNLLLGPVGFFLNFFSHGMPESVANISLIAAYLSNLAGTAIYAIGGLTLAELA